MKPLQKLATDKSACLAYKITPTGSNNKQTSATLTLLWLQIHSLTSVKNNIFNVHLTTVTFIDLICKKQYHFYSIQCKNIESGQPLFAKSHFDDVWLRACNLPIIASFLITKTVRNVFSVQKYCSKSLVTSNRWSSTTAGVYHKATVTS